MARSEKIEQATMTMKTVMAAPKTETDRSSRRRRRGTAARGKLVAAESFGAMVFRSVVWLGIAWTLLGAPRRSET